MNKPELDQVLNQIVTRVTKQNESTDSYDATVPITTQSKVKYFCRSNVNAKTKESRALAKTSKNEVDLISDFTK